jgi:hypothetical protein
VNEKLKGAIPWFKRFGASGAPKAIEPLTDIEFEYAPPTEGQSTTVVKLLPE